jgi:hypothetical protein
MEIEFHTSDLHERNEMSEERPTFKITDRRLFNPDGSPRDDIEREQDADTSDAATPNEADTQTNVQKPETATGTSAAREDDLRATENQQDPAESATTSGDPMFTNLLMFIASPAAAALGLTEHPGMGGREVDLELAKHCIDLLGSLQQKTRGNLSFEEQQTLDGLLGELRMQYLSLTGGISVPTGGARRGGGGGGGSTSSGRGGQTRGGFTGSDITGGR